MLPLQLFHNSSSKLFIKSLKELFGYCTLPSAVFVPAAWYGGWREGLGVAVGGLAGEALAESCVWGRAGGFPSVSGGGVWQIVFLLEPVPAALHFPLEPTGKKLSWGVQWERQLSWPPVPLACGELGSDAASLESL